MKKKRVPRIIDFTSLSDLFMLLSVLFLIMYSINSLRTGVVAIAEREKAKKEINEIEVKANLLKINALDLKSQKTIEKKIRELGNLEKKAAVIKNEQQKLMEIAIDRELNIKNYRELVENSLQARNLMQFEMDQEKKANEALQFQNEELKKAIKNSSKNLKTRRVTIAKIESELKDKKLKIKKQIKNINNQSKDIKSFDRELANVERQNIKQSKNILELRKERKELKKNLMKLNQVMAKLQSSQTELAKNYKVQKSKRAFQEMTSKKRLKEIFALKQKLREEKRTSNKKSRSIASVAQVNSGLGQKLAKTHQKLLYQEHIAFSRLMEVKNLSKSLGSANSALNSLKTSHGELQKKLASSESKAKNASRSIASLEAENADLMGYKNNYKGLIKEKEKLNQKIQKIENKGQIKKRLIMKIERSLSSHGVKGGINSKTGEVVLDFKEAFFKYGSSKLNPSMKAMLETFIRAYAKGLFEDPALSSYIKSINLVGSSSPTYNQKIITAPNLKTRWGQRAVSYNLDLSYRRARNMFNHLFNNPEVDFPNKERMLPFMKVTGVGFLKSRFPASVTGSGMDYCEQITCERYQNVKIGFTLK